MPMPLGGVLDATYLKSSYEVAVIQGKKNSFRKNTENK